MIVLINTDYKQYVVNNQSPFAKQLVTVLSSFTRSAPEASIKIFFVLFFLIFVFITTRYYLNISKEASRRRSSEALYNAVSHLQQQRKLTMDSQPSTSGQGSGDSGDRTPVHVVEDCDIGLKWKPCSKEVRCFTKHFKLIKLFFCINVPFFQLASGFGTT